MKKFLLVILVVGSYVTGFGQQEEKIKGNKDLVEKRISLAEPYHTIDADGDFEIFLRKQSTLSATIETDSNLLQYIDVSIENGVLTITTTKEIVRAKELKVEVGYTDELNTILIKDEVTIKGDQSLKGEKLFIDAKGNTALELDSNTDSTEILLKNRAKFEGIIVSKNVTMDQSGTSKMTATLTGAESVNVTLHEKSASQLEGDSQKSSYVIDGNAYLNAIKLTSTISSLSNADQSDAYIKCVDKTILQLSGKSKTYIMGNPLIQLTKFEGESSLHKTKKEPSSFGRLLK